MQKIAQKKVQSGTTAASPPSYSQYNGSSGESPAVLVEPAGDTIEPVREIPTRPETYEPTGTEIISQHDHALIRHELQMAQTALDARQFTKALVHSKNVLAVQPTNAQARRIQQEARNYVTATSPGGTFISRELKRRKIIADQITFRHRVAMSTADQLVAQKKFNEARNVVREAQAQVLTNRAILPAFDLARMETESKQMIATIDQQQKIYEQEQVEEEQKRANTIAKKTLRAAEQERQGRVKELFFQGATLMRQRKYELALDRFRQILAIDPNNQSAREFATAMQDMVWFLQAQSLEPEKDLAIQEALQNIGKTAIPHDPDEGITFGDDWEELTIRRKDYGNIAQDSPENVEARTLLKVKHPRFEYPEWTLTEVIDDIREKSGLNIQVNWNSLEYAGIDREQEVTLQLKNVSVERALKSILDNLSSSAGAYGDDYGYGTTIAFGLQDGIVVIANSEDLARDYYPVAHDISDLLLETTDLRGGTLYDSGTGDSYNNDNRDSSSSSSSSSYRDDRSSSRSRDDRSSSRRDDRSSSSNRSGSDSNRDSDSNRGDVIGRIIDLVVMNAPADSWRETTTGTGEGTVEIFGTRLMVYQTAENHIKIKNMLDQLRQTRPIQISVEPRFLFITDNFLEDIGVDLDIYLEPKGSWSGPAGPADPIPVLFGSYGATRHSATGLPGSLGGSGISAFSLAGTFLDSLEVDFLIRATQATSQASTLTAPRVTFENGGGANIFVGREIAYVASVTTETDENAVGYEIESDVIETGPTLNVAGVVSPDRRFVRLEIDVTLNELVDLVNVGDLVPTAPTLTPELSLEQLPIMDTTTITTQVSVPDGGALLIGGLKRSAEEKRVVGIPIISKLPYINRLFTNKSKVADRYVLIILLRPRIIDLKEIEGLKYPMLGER